MIAAIISAFALASAAHLARGVFADLRPTHRKRAERAARKAW